MKKTTSEWQEYLKCKKTLFGYRHNWEKWREFERNDLMVGERRIGKIFYQERECINCGFKELNIQKVRI